MSWEGKGNKKYYYQKERVGNKVRSIYIGKGPIAQLTAAAEEIQRNDRRLQRMIINQVLENEKNWIDTVIQINKRNSNIVKALLLIQGFHTHKGQWRRRNVKSNK